jgi:NAD(P)-dependent dehydrogenase (short-subunit alcohol dehydrogenase family)
MNKVALVTGASTGIGFATSIALARNGYTTFATMRDMSKSKAIARKDELPLSVIQIDVNAYESIKSGVDKIFADTKRIDVLVNNAGYGLFRRRFEYECNNSSI